MNIDDQPGKDFTYKHQVAIPHDRDKSLDAASRNLASAHPRTSTNFDSDRVRELEAENLRLRHLVAELLVKNQQERELSRSASPAPYSDERSNASPAWDKRDATRIFS